MFKPFRVKLNVAPAAMVIVVQRKMPSDGRFKVLFAVMFIGPYEPSLPETDSATNSKSKLVSELLGPVWWISTAITLLPATSSAGFS